MWFVWSHAFNWTNLRKKNNVQLEEKHIQLVTCFQKAESGSDSAGLAPKLKDNDCILYWMVIMVQTI